MDRHGTLRHRGTCRSRVRQRRDRCADRAARDASASARGSLLAADAHRVAAAHDLGAQARRHGWPAGTRTASVYQRLLASDRFAPGTPHARSLAQLQERHLRSHHGGERADRMADQRPPGISSRAPHRPRRDGAERRLRHRSLVRRIETRHRSLSVVAAPGAAWPSPHAHRGARGRARRDRHHATAHRLKDSPMKRQHDQQVWRDAKMEAAVWVLIPLCVVLLTARGHAQTAAPSFEVASVKINTSGDVQVRLSAPPGSGRIDITNMMLRGVIQAAYQIQPFQLVNIPNWVLTQRIDIVAKADPSGMFTSWNGWI